MQTRFGWIGPLRRRRAPFYYRVHSPVILIEFDHQSGVAFKGDEPARAITSTPWCARRTATTTARDLLRQHYLQHDHSHPHTPHRLGHE